MSALAIDFTQPFEDAFSKLLGFVPNLLGGLVILVIGYIVAKVLGKLVGTLQLSIIPGLSRKGATRGLVEAVRVAASARGTGLGTTLMEWSIEEARTRGCTIVQLTSDKARTDAHRFYLRLGFTNTHEGFKLTLN